MRRGWVLLGAVVVLVGLLLAYLPLSSGSTGTVYVPSSATQEVIGFSAEYDLLFPRIQYTITWQSTENNTSVAVLPCGASAGCADPGTVPVASQLGASGTITFIGQANLYYQVVPVDGAITMVVVYTSPLFSGGLGFGLVLVGVIGVAAGFTRAQHDEEPPTEFEVVVEPPT
jgi:hypothetical protein